MRRLLNQSSGVVLILANLVPLAGVILLRWSIFSVVFLFWFENVIVGVINILKMLTVAALGEGPLRGIEPRWIGRVLCLFGGLFMTGFFTIHYGMFCFGHGAFVMLLVGGVKGDPFQGLADSLRNLLTGEYLWAALALLVSHGYSFVVNFLVRKEFSRLSMDKLMMAPYGRVVVLHIAILLGAFLAAFLKSAYGVLIVLVVLKIVLDVRLHLKERESGALSLVPKRKQKPA